MNQFGYYNYDNVPYIPIGDLSAGNGLVTMLLVFVAVVMAVYLLALVVGIALYALQSVGFYTIAKRRGICNSWLAWLPVGNMWILGSLSDQYQYVKLGKVTNRRKTLVALQVASVVATALEIGTKILVWINTMLVGGGQTLLSAGGTVLIECLSSGLSIAVFVIACMAFYDVFRSCNPEHSIVFLILGIFFPFTIPFFLFFNRRKDDGMPPRRKPAAQRQPEEANQTVAEDAAVSVETEETPVQEASAEE